MAGLHQNHVIGTAGMAEIIDPALVLRFDVGDLLGKRRAFLGVIMA